jgi:hypothetical protein
MEVRGALGSQATLDKLASRIAEQRRLSIDLLTDRSAMSRDLCDLMKAVSIPPAH